MELPNLMLKTLFDLSVQCVNDQILAKPSNEIVFGRLLAEGKRILHDLLWHGPLACFTRGREKEGSGSPCHLQHHRGNEQWGETSRDTREDIACAEISDCRGHDLHNP